MGVVALVLWRRWCDVVILDAAHVVVLPICNLHLLFLTFFKFTHLTSMRLQQSLSNYKSPGNNSSNDSQ